MANPPAAPHPTMAFDFGLNDPDSCLMRKFRWMLFIEGVSGDVNGVKALPPSKAARPTFNFKEQMVAHLVENLYYPVRAEWKPITLTLFENRSRDRVGFGQNPVFDWIKQVYNPKSGEWFPIKTGACNPDNQVKCFKRNATLVMYGGCGDILEIWTFENAYPQNVEWGDLDMASSEVVMVDVTLRYDRAYLLGDANVFGDGES